MQFKIRNNQTFFRDYNLSEFMNIKEISINAETNEAFITAEFKASVDYEIKNGFLACMLEDMSEDNLLDLKSELENILENKII